RSCVQGGNRSLGGGMVVVQVLRPLFAKGAIQAGAAFDQLGNGDARMSGDAANTPACVIAAPLQLECPVQHGQLGLGVGAVGVVVQLGLQVIEIQRAAGGGDTGQADHPTILAFPK